MAGWLELRTAAALYHPMPIRRLLLTALVAFVALAGLPLQAWASPGAVVTTPQVRAELVAHAPQGVAMGKPLWLGLKI